MFIMKKILIIGVNGQDGSLMSDYILKNENIEIFGTVRSKLTSNMDNISHIKNNKFNIVEMQLNTECIYKVIEEIKPDYIINFAAQSNVATSWDCPKETTITNTLPIIDIMEAMIKYCPKSRFYNAGSSEEFGNIIYCPQDEMHPLKPLSPYASSKVSSRQLINVYRETYKLYVIQGWLFNHEGIRRNDNFVTRKITKKVAEINYSLKNKKEVKPIELGNLYSSRDWSDAEDFMDGIWRMLNQDIFDKHFNGVPKEYVLASNKTHTIKNFVEESFKVIKINGYWENNTDNEINETFCYQNNNEKLLLVKINPIFYRKCDLIKTCGNSLKIKYELGWEPKIEFKDLVKKMVEHDISILK